MANWNCWLGISGSFKKPTSNMEPCQDAVFPDVNRYKLTAVKAPLTEAEALQAVYSRQAGPGSSPNVRSSLYTDPQSPAVALFGVGSRCMGRQLLCKVPLCGQVGQGFGSAAGKYIGFRGLQGGDTGGHLVQAAAIHGFLHIQYASAEPVGIPVAPLECSVDEEYQEACCVLLRGFTADSVMVLSSLLPGR